MDLIEAEEKEKGSVTFSDIRGFLKFSGGDLSILAYIVAGMWPAFMTLAISLWMGYWAGQEFDEQQKSFYPLIMLSMVFLLALGSFVRDSTIFNIFIQTTSAMHISMSNRILRSKILFFDSNPIGRILTRFSKDIATLDLIVPTVSVLMTYGIFRALTVTISLCIINYYLLVPTVLAVAYLAYLLKYASIAMIEAQRLDAIVRGPIHSLFAMVINGLVSIRAYEQVPHFR